MPIPPSVILSDLSPAAVDRIDQQMVAALETATASGIALALVDRYGNRIVRGYGERAIGTGQPVDAETAFEIGSIGKSFTAIVFMQLAADGIVDLQAPVTDYLPWFSIQSSHRPITIHDLLTHTSGLPGGDDPVPDARLEVWLLRDAPTYAAPGEHFLYSNVGFKTLGLVLEAVLNQPYAQIIQERIFDPLGMVHAHGAITSAMRPLMAQGHASQYDDRPRIARHGIVPATWLETDTGDGCLAMTATDLLTYAAMLLVVSSGETTPVLTATQLQTMRDPHAGAPTPEPTYGYALHSYPANDGPERFGHSGGMVGYLSQMTVDITNGVAVVLLVNGEADTTGLTTFALDVVQAEANGLDLPAVTPAPDPFDLSALADLAGNWTSGSRRFLIEQEGEEGLLLVEGVDRIRLQFAAGLRGRGQVIIDHPDWEPYPLTIVRPASEDSDDGEAPPPPVKLHWGSETFHRPGSEPTQPPIYPPTWDAFVGHYRSFNPWRSNIRVVVREGELTMLGPYGHASRLIPDGDKFWIEDAPRPSSDWLQFDALVNGQALRVRSNVGEVFARFFTP